MFLHKSFLGHGRIEIKQKKINGKKRLLGLPPILG